jgi:signal transduction histidine kinase/ActR/RegA family two-component response regulator
MTEEAHNLAQHLRQSRDQIVSIFVAEVQNTELAPSGAPRALLVDHIPTFLDEIAAELERLQEVRVSADAQDESLVARRHGEQRWVLGYDLPSLVREYGVLRQCVVRTAKYANITISMDEFDVLAKCLSVGVAEAATEYVREHNEKLLAQSERLAFVAEAGQLLSSSLDYRWTLSRLTTLIVPRLADCCVVHLDGNVDEMPVAHVDPTKNDLLREIYQRFPLPADSAFGYPAVQRTGEPQLMVEVSATVEQAVSQSPEHLTLLRRLHARSYLIVPLRVQEHMFGALALMYCDSGRRYTEQDLVLARDLAQRAAVALDNARLYDLSQRERSRVEVTIRAKDEFVAMVSHELRTPLNAILGWVQLIRRGSLDEAKRVHAFEVIARNVTALNRIVADLLDISSTISGKLRINPAQVNLRDVVDMVIEGALPAAQAKQVQIEADLEQQDAVLRGDGERLQQVVWNLLVNAIKFTPKHGSIRVQLRRIRSDLELSVADTGIGIDPTFLPHVFERFRQSDTSSSRSYGGLGIGLSITKHIVELHGGSVEARSAGQGLGATFLVRLPVSPLVSASLGVSRVPATKSAAESVRPAPPEARGLRVLVVDDDPDARDLVMHVLESCGMEVRAASNASEARAALLDEIPHVLLSDIGLPGEDGYSLIRSIRTLPIAEQREVPAIALTAFARNEDRTRALVEGFNLHLTKPAEPSALVQAICELAGHAAQG